MPREVVIEELDRLLLENIQLKIEIANRELDRLARRRVEINTHIKEKYGIDGVYNPSNGKIVESNTNEVLGD